MNATAAGSFVPPGCRTTKLGGESARRLVIQVMKNLITDHPSEDVRTAAIRLLDALCMWERTTGRHNLFIVKDSIGCQYRSMDGSPVPDHVGDHTLLEAFDGLSPNEQR